MPRSAFFILAESKITRARDELRKLDHFMADGDGHRNDWSRMATIAFAVHGIYTGIEDVMLDLARDIDEHVPTGGTSHQALLDQMRVDMDGRRPALLDDVLHRDLTELKAFRHLVRHQYGVDLVPEKVEAKHPLAASALAAFEAAMRRLEAALDTP